jgi:hypothetical protein
MHRILPFLPLLPVAGLIFHAGMQAEKLDDLFNKSYALEADQKSTRDVLFDIHGKVCAIQEEIKSLSSRFK